MVNFGFATPLTTLYDLTQPRRASFSWAPSPRRRACGRPRRGPSPRKSRRSCCPPARRMKVVGGSPGPAIHSKLWYRLDEKNFKSATVRVLTCALLDSVFLSRSISERYCRRRDEEAAAAGDLLLLLPPPLLGRLCGDWRWCDDDIEEIAAIERALKVGFENISCVDMVPFTCL